VVYTVGYEKGITLFLTITLAVLEQFLRFLDQWKQELILYRLLALWLDDVINA